MKKIIFALAAISLGFAACQKEQPTIDVSKTKYLMDGYWQLKGYTTNANYEDSSSTDVDQYGTLPNCLTDNLYRFRSASDFVVYEQDLKCDVTQPDSTEMFWQLNSEETNLKVYKDQADIDNTLFWSGDMTYTSIDTFVLTYLYTDSGSGITERRKATYVKL